MNLVSIIIPVYKVEKYLVKCVESVIHQTYHDLEIILVDDESPDNCPTMCDRYKTTDSRIKVVHRINGGLSRARNSGLDVATGEYVMFLDSDDYARPDWVEVSISSLQRTDAEILVYNYNIESEQTKTIETTDFQPMHMSINNAKDTFNMFVHYYLKWKFSFSVWNKVYVRKIIEDNCIRFEDNNRIFAEDIYFNMCYMLYVHRLVCIEDSLMTYVKRTDSIMGVRASETKLNQFVNLSNSIEQYISQHQEDKYIGNHFYIIYFLLMNNQYSQTSFRNVLKAVNDIENIHEYKKKNSSIIKNFIQMYKILGIRVSVRAVSYSFITLLKLRGIRLKETFSHKIRACKNTVTNLIYTKKRAGMWRKMSKTYISFAGGLGNQMFQYALYRKIEKLGGSPIGDMMSYRYKELMPYVLEEVFPNITMKKEYDKHTVWDDAKRKILDKRYPIEKERKSAEYQPELLKGIIRKNICLQGYWQTEKYFNDIRQELLKDYEFKLEDKSLSNVVNKVKVQNSVSIHIRRGDYLNHNAMYGEICTLEYYSKAMAYMRARINEIQFYVFSDDIQWVKNTILGNDVHYVESADFKEYQDWYDMAIMSNCKHNIIANSSFSWWGAWLNNNPDKIVIAPNIWLNNEETSDIWCDGWIRL